MAPTNIVAIVQVLFSPSPRRVPVDIGADPIADLVFQVRPGVDVTGNVLIHGDPNAVRLDSIQLHLTSGVYSTTTRVPEALVVRSAQDLDAAATGLTPEPGFQHPQLKPGAADSNGAFTIRSVPEGRFSVVPILPDGAYIADVLQDGKSIMETGLTIGIETPKPLEVIVSTAAGAVEGTLFGPEEKGIGYMQVVLVPSTSQRANFGLYRTANSNYRGRFVFENVPPGEYKLFAWSDISDGAWTDAPTMERYDDRGVRVSVKEGSRVVDQQLHLIVD